MTLTLIDALFSLLQLVTTALIALIGWHASRQATRLEEVAQRVADLELKVAEQHPTKAELIMLKNEIREIVADAVQPLRAEMSLLSRMIEARRNAP